MNTLLRAAARILPALVLCVPAAVGQTADPALVTLTHWDNVEWADAATGRPEHDGLTKPGERQMERVAAELQKTEAPLILDGPDGR